ncbi:ABC transporter ATP-binding protein [Anaeromicropila populeti]|uniref:ABC-2 type transport system ATP-binding protein n=1 Tax=Anaeromicropila populeti TaxID=37658 RepID=A0A1I6LVX4_9FIRM|nr:ATP-binding cassette domain-containing protein [Anaeromicropila populeti]SFS07576.1 ABC-2 type transport system ATP-binding protein [Anaeromicropila populeti]
MKPIISLNNVNKEFKLVKRHEGLKGSIHDLFTREYNIIQAVNNISIQVMPGEIVGYLGPNGAGKSTTIKMMTGVLEPTSGEVLVDNIIPYKNRTLHAQKIGVVFGQRTQLWWSLPLIESFKILKDIYQISNATYQDMMKFYESIVDIEPLYHKPVRQMSLGQRTLSDILAAFLHNPKVVFLDEPTIGLDVSMKSKIHDLINAVNREKETTVILTTHDISDVDALCKRIVIIDKGKMIYDEGIDSLKKHFGAYRTIKVKFEGDNNLRLELNRQVVKKLQEFISDKVTIEEDWISILTNEKDKSAMDILNYLQTIHSINDMQILDISTESVIKKIYEEDID